MTITYTEATPVHVPIEVRLIGRGNGRTYILTAWQTGHGTVNHSLNNGLGGPAESLSNLQLKGPARMPGKARPGWQAAVVAAVGTGLYTIAEVR